MGRVIHGAQGVGHGVGNAQAHIGKAHTSDVLAQGHALPAFLGAFHSAPQVGSDQADGLQMEHIGHLPGAGSGVALDGVGQGVHAGGSGEALGHGIHHVRVNHGHNGHIMGVYADKLPLALHIGDYIVDGDLCGSAGSGGYGDDRHAGLLGGGHTLQRADVRKLGVVDDDTHGLGSVHSGAAADGQDVVSPGGLEGVHAVHYVLNGGVGLNVGKYFIGQALRVQNVGDLGDHTVLEQGGAAADQGLFEAVGLDLIGDLFDGAGAVVGSLIEHDSVCHDSKTPFKIRFLSCMFAL